MMTPTAVVSRSFKDSDCELIQFYVNGGHVGYAKLDVNYIRFILKALQAVRFTVIDTTAPPALSVDGDA